MTRPTGLIGAVVRRLHVTTETLHGGRKGVERRRLETYDVTVPMSYDAPPRRVEKGAPDVTMQHPPHRQTRRWTPYVKKGVNGDH